MVNSKLSTIVKTVRFRYAVLFVLLLLGLYLIVIHPWMKNWGSTQAEQQMPLTGDELLPIGSQFSTKAITINAPPDVIWQWLIQVGQERAGFYTYTWLENLVGADIHNVNEIRPEWQQLDVGDAWRLVPADYLGGLGKDAVSPVLISEPGQALVIEMFGAHVILPIDEQTSRFLVRGSSGADNLLIKIAWDPIVFTLERRMLLGLKARAEGRPDAHPALMVIAHLGWIATGITVAVLFLIERRRRFWLALPLIAALPALLMGKDIQAALAAFLTVGISLLGFLFFGRSWWGPMLVIGSVVLLTLLLVPEAYVAIGLVFVLILLAVVIVISVERWRSVSSALQQQATSPGNPNLFYFRLNKKGQIS